MESHNLRAVTDSLRDIQERAAKSLKECREVATLLEDVPALRKSHAELADQVEGLKVENHGLRNRLTVAETTVELCRQWFIEQFNTALELPEIDPDEWAPRLGGTQELQEILGVEL